MKALLLIAALALSLAGAAEAKVVRHPATGTPAITVNVPDGWTSKLDTRGVNLLLGSPDGAVGFSIYLGKVTEDLGLLAQAVKQSLGPSLKSFEKQGDGKFLTYTSQVWLGRMEMAEKKGNVRLTLFRIDPANIGSVSLITYDTTTAAQKAQGESVSASIRVIAQ